MTRRPPTHAELLGIEAACNAALASFEAAPDGSGDVSAMDARRIRRALAWVTSHLHHPHKPKGEPA